MNHKKLLAAAVSTAMLTISVFSFGAVRTGADIVDTKASATETNEKENTVDNKMEMKSYRHIILSDADHLRRELRSARKLAKKMEVKEEVSTEAIVPETLAAVTVEPEVYEEEPVYTETVNTEVAYDETGEVGDAVYEEPVYEEPTYEEPAYEEPVYEEPAYEEPVNEEDSYEEEYTDDGYEEEYTETDPDQETYTEESYSEEYYEEGDSYGDYEDESDYDRAYVSDSELDLLAAIIQCEAGGESYEGKVAVGAVVLNRMDSSLYPDDMSDVIYQPWQFTPAMTGNLQNVLASGARDDCYEAAQAALNGENPVGDCLYFHAGSGNGLTIGNQTFY